jgi:3-oxoacyl-[acyl-carrier-protein] synthase II
MPSSPHRVVLTGWGLISPLGNSADELWSAVTAGRSGVGFLQQLPADKSPVRFGGEARGFSGDIEDFGELAKDLKRSIKKGLKLMCREIEMGVAAAQRALADAGLAPGTYDSDRIGCVFGSDYIMTLPQEFAAGIRRCQAERSGFEMNRWGQEGLPQVEPLWLLKYLPNMPASHVAIYNDLRGPSNSITVREASSNMAVAEAATTIRRGVADIMLAGATGTRIHPLRTVHIALQEQLANGSGDPTTACRPFDQHRQGMVLGEGASVLVIESLESATRRGARVLGEVLGYATSTVANRYGVADYRKALRNVLEMALERAGATTRDIGHIHAHGLGTRRLDEEEAAAIRDVFGSYDVPVMALKSYMGNLGAGSGMVETIASILAMRAGSLFPVLNYTTPDPRCPIDVVRDRATPAGSTAINVNVTPQGQASALVIGVSA